MGKWGGILFTLILMMTSLAQASEVIQSYEVLAKVFPDGQVDVREDITVNAENDQIRHGIYRDFPTDYTDRMGNRVRVSFELGQVKRDGSSEPYHIDTLDNGLRIYIGDKDNFVSTGMHRYTVSYSVRRVIGFFDSYDELYWNVTGNGWVFPIQKAFIRIEFPTGAVVGQYAGYTGGLGTQGKAYRAGAEENIFTAETTNPLSAYEGFTVAASIPKGIVRPETEVQKLFIFLHDNLVWVICGGLTLFSAVFFFGAWWRFGRDTSGVIIPRFDVPEEVSPDLLLYVTKQGYNQKALTCAIVEAAVKGKLEITDNKNNIVISRKAPREMGHFNIAQALFERSGSLTLPKKTFFGGGDASRKERKETAIFLQKVQSEHSFSLRSVENQYFSKNSGVRWIGWGIFALTLLCSYSLSWNDDQKEAAFFSSIIAQGLLIGFFSKPLNKYTQKGQELVDYAAGLKMFLSVAEEARLNALYPKTITPEKFEQMLPYALALGVEQKWCEYFSGLVKAGLAQYDENRSDHWYHSYDRNGFRISNLGNSLGKDLGSTISSASTPPGSSSGSGGGGSSGGGGGGGGGGGW